MFGCNVPTYLDPSAFHFWRNDRALLRATAVTRGRNGYQNERQHRELIQEKKILPPLLPGFELATFRARIRRATSELYPRLQNLIGQAKPALVHLLYTRHTLLKFLFVVLGLALFRLARHRQAHSKVLPNVDS